MVKQVLGISGGKDSAALAIYLKNKYPELPLVYYNTDTGCELEETELLISRLESIIGQICMTNTHDKGHLVFMFYLCFI